MPLGRSFYDVVALPSQDMAIVAAAVLAWAGLVHWTWRHRTFQRFLGLHDGAAPQGEGPWRSGT